MSKRNSTIDISKGIGIFLVVLGHNPMTTHWSYEPFNVIFSFHIPLFFFLSGAVFNSNSSFQQVTLKKSSSLLKPYFSILISLGMVYFICQGEPLLTYLVNTLYGTGSTIKWGPMWFIVHLFATSLFSLAVMKFFRFSILKISVKLFVLAVMLSIGVVFIGTFWHVDLAFRGYHVSLPGLPFSIDIILVTSSFFILGNVFSAYINDFAINCKFLFLSLLVFINCHVFFNETMNLNLRKYDGLIIPTLEAICGIYIVVSLASLLNYYSKITKFLWALGSSSLFILIFHSFFQSNIFKIMHNTLTINLVLSSVAALIVGLLCPIAIHHIVKKNKLLSLMILPKCRKRIDCKTNMVRSI